VTTSWAPRDPTIAALLALGPPAATQQLEWGGGEFRCRLDAYTSAIDLPEEFVGSVRVLVLVDDRIVICTNKHGKSHPWPGGRREPGESYVETGCREVHEETGWLLDPESLQHIGWLHFEHQLGRPSLHRWDSADFLMTVYVGRARDRDGGRDNDWSDTEGHELSSALMTIDDAIALVAPQEPSAVPFLEVVRDRGVRSWG
jgi:ADP-ribose pyrophosphatase YjhB (NUDIX family)